MLDPKNRANISVAMRIQSRANRHQHQPHIGQMQRRAADRADDVAGAERFSLIEAPAHLVQTDRKQGAAEHKGGGKWQQKVDKIEIVKTSDQRIAEECDEKPVSETESGAAPHIRPASGKPLPDIVGSDLPDRDVGYCIGIHRSVPSSVAAS